MGEASCFGIVLIPILCFVQGLHGLRESGKQFVYAKLYVASVEGEYPTLTQNIECREAEDARRINPCKVFSTRKWLDMRLMK